MTRAYTAVVALPNPGDSDSKPSRGRTMAGMALTSADEVQPVLSVKCSAGSRQVGQAGEWLGGESGRVDGK